MRKNIFNKMKKEIMVQHNDLEGKTIAAANTHVQ